MRKLRKAFVISVMFVTVLSMSVVAAPDAGAAASAGDLIKMDGLSSVYYLGADGKRYVFPNETTYFSWYSDWTGVVTIPQSELESYPLAANVTIRPGTKLVKITTNPTVYAVEPNGTLRSIVSEANAAAVYGANWAQRVVDVPDAFFTNYTTGDPLTEGAYAIGSLVKTADSADIYYYDGTNYRKFADEAALAANRYSTDDVLIASSAITAGGTEIAAADSSLIDTSEGGGSGVGISPTAGTGLTVALASDTPAAASILTDGAGTALDGQALIPALKLDFTAASDGDVKITGLKLKRTGISSDSDVDNVYLYDGDSITSRVAEMQSISSKIVTFSNSSGLFTVKAGTSKTILVRFDVNRESTSGKTIGFNLEAAADITTDGATVSGSYPMSGNLLSTATVTDFGGVQVSRVADNSTAVDPGATGFTAAHFQVTPANQDMQLEYLKLQMVGSASTADIKNVKLYDSTTQLGETQQLDSNKRVVFDLSGSPLAISSSQTKNLYVKVDVESGATRTFYFSIQKGADVIVYEKSYGIYLRPKSSATVGTFTSQDSSTVTVGSGSLGVSRTTDSPTGNIADAATNITLAKYSMKATGEDIKVSSIAYYTTIAGTGTTLKNSKILVDGTQVGTTNTTLTSGSGNTVTTTVNFTVQAGTTKYLTLVADTTGSTVADDTVTMTLNVGASNGQRMSALTTLNVPSSSIAANTLTVKTGTVVTANNVGVGDYSAANPTGVVGTKNVRIGSFTITAGAGEDVDITKITITDNGTDVLADEYENLLIKRQDTGAQIGSTISTLQTSTSYSYEFSPTTAIRLTNGNTLIVDIYADILTNAAKTASAYNAVRIASVNATGVSTASDASDTNTRALQNVYIAASGTLLIENVPASDQVQSNIVYASGAADNEVELYKFKLTANTEAIKISRFIISDTITASAYNATTSSGKPTTTLSNFKLYNSDGALIAGPVALNATSTPVNGGYLDFNLGTGNDYEVAAGAEKTLVLKAVANTWNFVSSGATHQFSLNATPIENSASSPTRALTARGGDSNVDKSGPTTGISGNAITVRRSYPVVTREALPATLAAGSTDSAVIAKFKVTATGGEVRLKKMTFNVTLNDTTTSTLLALTNFKLFRNGVEISRSSTAGTGQVAIYDGTGTATADQLSIATGGATLSTNAILHAGGAPNTTSTRVVVVFGAHNDFAATGDGDGEDIISAGSSNTYEIKADVANAHQGATTDSDSIVVTMLGDDGQSQPYTGDLSNINNSNSNTTYRIGVLGLNNTNYAFVWSDNSANLGDHTNTLPSTGSDWTHGYQVRSTTATPASYLPLDAWTLGK